MRMENNFALVRIESSSSYSDMESDTGIATKHSDETPLLFSGDKGQLQEPLKSYVASQDESVRHNERGDDDNLHQNRNVNGDGAAKPGRGSSYFIYLLTFFSAIGGFLFGYDTGVVSGAMIIIRDQFHLNSLWQELIVSVTIGAAAFFAIVGGYLNDWLGRKPTTLIASFIFTAGALVLGLAMNKTMLLLGRFIVGVGIGLASMTTPMYIAESAPVRARGRLVTLNNIFITGGQFVACLVDGGFSYDQKNGWRFMLGLAALPSVIQFVGFLYLPESPRWLVQKGNFSKAKKVLLDIRGASYKENELEQIKASCEEDEQAKREAGSSGTVIIRILTTPHVRRAVILGCALQMFQQLSGINTVMYYSATIITMSGIRDKSSAIWLAAVTSSVNFLFTFVGLALVEKIGRRPLFLGSLAGTVLGLGFLGIGFHLSAFNSPHLTPPLGGMSSDCGNTTSCDQCISLVDCGFCYIDFGGGNISDLLCLPTRPSDPYSSLSGMCNSTDLPQDIAWAYDYCPTPYSWMAIAGLMIYLAFFAPGVGPMPWTINSEIYPLWARSTGAAMATCSNWLFNLLISMTFLTLTEALTRYGAFYLYTGLALLGLIIFTWILPETKGKTLEEVQTLFMKPWCC